MTNNLIFSNKLQHRLTRHVLFWGLYGLMLFLVAGGPRHIYIICFLPLFMLSAYLLIYVLLPRFLQKKKRLAAFVFGFFIVYMLTLGVACYTSSVFFGFWDGPIPFKMKFGLALHNQTLAMCIGGVALGIKATKSWYTRQKENMSLAQQKARNEVKLEKANLYPEFLLQALNSLHLKISAGSKESPDLLLKLSDTLSYILYESQNELIALEKELKMVKNMVEFRNLQSSGPGKVDYINTGIAENKFIVPLTLFGITQNLFQSIPIDAQDPGIIHLSIEIEKHHLLVQLTESDSNPCYTEGLHGQQRKLNKIYHTFHPKYQPECKLKVSEDESTYSISFTLALTILPHSDQIIFNPANRNVLA